MARDTSAAQAARATRAGARALEMPSRAIVARGGGAPVLLAIGLVIGLFHAVPPAATARRSPPSIAAVTTMHAFTRAFASRDYAAMWQLLAPTARRGWGGESGYIAYDRAKFAPTHLISVSLGRPDVISGTVIDIPVTLDLQWRSGDPPGVLSLFDNLVATVRRTPVGWRVSEGGPFDPAAPVIPPNASRFPRTVRRVPILMYHHISDTRPGAWSQVNLTVSTHAFLKQLGYLAAQGYHTVTLTDLFNKLYYGRPLPTHPVILTFDDGYRDNYFDAFPLLRRFGMIGEFNVVTGYAGRSVGVNSYMTWPEIETLAAAGMEIESHTVDHQDLGRVTPRHAAFELRFSRAVLAAHIHRAVQFLAYPSGEPFRSGTRAARQRILLLLPRYGYVGALLDPVAPDSRQDAREPYELMRVRVSPGLSLAAFGAQLRT